MQNPSIGIPQSIIDIGISSSVFNRFNNNNITNKVPVILTNPFIDVYDAIEKDEYFIDVLELMERGDCTQNLKEVILYDKNFFEEPVNKGLLYSLSALIRNLWE